MRITQTLEGRIYFSSTRTKLWRQLGDTAYRQPFEHYIAGRDLTEDVGDVAEQRQRDGVADEVVVGHKEQPRHHRQAVKRALPLQQVLCIIASSVVNAGATG